MKRIIAYFLAIFMIASVVFSCVSCDVSSIVNQLLEDPGIDAESTDEEKETKKPSDSTDSTDDTDSTKEDTTEDTTFEAESDSDIENDTTPPVDTPIDPPSYEFDGQGQTLTILSAEGGMNNYFIHKEESGYNILADHLDERNNYIAEQYNFIVENNFVPQSDVYNKVQASWMVQDNSIQTFTPPASAGLGTYIARGYLCSFENLEIDLSADHWNQSLMENISYNGRQYAGYGDMLLTDTNVIIFNKDRAAYYNIEDLYEIVHNGEWTIEKMYEISMQCFEDWGGGYASYGISGDFRATVNNFVFASGMALSSKNESKGIYEIYGSEDKLYQVYDNIYNMLKCNPAAYDTFDGNKNVFSEGNSVFELSTTYQIGAYSNVEFSYGILPYPKAEADQMDYSSNYSGSYICVLSGVTDIYFTGKALDIVNKHSSDIEDRLWSRLLTSQEDMDMMNTVRRNLVNDFAFVYLKQELSGMINLFSTSFMNDSSSIAKDYKMNINKWNSELRQHKY